MLHDHNLLMFANSTTCNDKVAIVYKCVSKSQLLILTILTDYNCYLMMLVFIAHYLHLFKCKHTVN